MDNNKCCYLLKYGKVENGMKKYFEILISFMGFQFQNYHQFPILSIIVKRSEGQPNVVMSRIMHIDYV